MPTTTNWSDPNTRRAAVDKLVARLRENPGLLEALKNNPASAADTLQSAGLEISPGALKVLGYILGERSAGTMVDIKTLAASGPVADDNDLWGNWGGMWSPGKGPKGPQL